MKPKACQMFFMCAETRDPQLWQIFIERHDTRVRRLLSAALKCFARVHYELDDLAQDFYCRLFTVSSTSFRGWTDHQLWRYFNRIAHNLIIDHHRAATAVKRRRDRLAGWQAGLETIVEDHHDTPEESLLRREERHHLFALFSKVTGRDHRAPLKKRALRLALLDGWSSREIAEELAGSLSSGQIDAMIHRLRRKLAQEGLRFPRRRPGRRTSSRGATGSHKSTRTCRRIA